MCGQKLKTKRKLHMIIRIDVMHPFSIRYHIDICLDVKQNVRNVFLTFGLAPLHIMIENGFHRHKINEKKFLITMKSGKKNLVATRLAVENF
jgi:hypothetical protein